MTCTECKDRAPLYHSGELAPADRAIFDAHLAACPPCAREIAEEAALDARLADAYSALPDTRRIEAHLRREIHPRRPQWIAMLATAAALITIVAATVRWLTPTPVSAAYAAAAEDHRDEIVNKQPRRWRTAAADVDKVSEPYGFSFATASALAPAGYALECAKVCGIDGHRMLHLVYSDGTKKYSVFVARHTGPTASLRVVHAGEEQVAGFDTSRFHTFVVTTGSARDCEELARATSGRL